MRAATKLEERWRLRVRAEIGLLAALGSALAYGITVVIGRSLARDGLDGPPVLAWRFGLGTLVLLAFQVLRGPVTPVVGERGRAAGLGLLYGVQASVFFAALRHGTAGAVALVFYVYPALVALGELARHTLRWSGRLAAAMGLSAAGVLAVVAVEGRLAIDAAGVLLALGGAALFALYMLAGEGLLASTDTVVRAIWASGGATVMVAAVALLTAEQWPGRSHAPLLLGYGLANAAAFGLMFAAVRRIGPFRTAVILNFEVASSVGLAVVFLDETLAPLQAAGGLLVVAGAVLAAHRDRDAPPLEPEVPA